MTATSPTMGFSPAWICVYSYKSYKILRVIALYGLENSFIALCLVICTLPPYKDPSKPFRDRVWHKCVTVILCMVTRCGSLHKLVFTVKGIFSRERWRMCCYRYKAKYLRDGIILCPISRLAIWGLLPGPLTHSQGETQFTEDAASSLSVLEKGFTGLGLKHGDILPSSSAENRKREVTIPYWNLIRIKYILTYGTLVRR